MWTGRRVGKGGMLETLNPEYRNRPSCERQQSTVLEAVTPYLQPRALSQNLHCVWT